MGGTGSGRWTYHNKKRTVEECWAMGISEVARVVDLRGFRPTSGTLPPTVSSKSGRMGPIRCTPRADKNGEPLLTVVYGTVDRWGLERRVEENIPLQTTQPNFGGTRWWFGCPRTINGRKCGRRAGKLYRAPGTRNFACRRCLDLTYESCQKSHRYDGLFAVMAAEAPGLTPEIVTAVFTPPTSIHAHNKSIDQRLLRAFEEVFLE